MLLSIITINYNNANGLERTINSVKEQASKEFEYIVIDGDSQDDSKKVLKKYSTSIDYWISEPDEGVYHAMNKGIAKASGAYLLFLNSGDIFNTNIVISKAETSLLQNTDIVYGDLWIVNEQGEGFRNRYPNSIDFLFLKRTSIGHPSTFIKKKLFDDYGLYRTDLKIVSDWAFFIEVLCKHRVSQHKMDYVVATFYEGGISTSEIYNKEHAKERSIVLKEMFSVYDEAFDEYIEKFEKQKGLISNLDQGIETIVTNKQLLKILNSIIRGFAFILKKKRS